MPHDRAWLKVRDYAFICHADKDKPRINDLRLLPGVTDNNEVSVTRDRQRRRDRPRQSPVQCLQLPRRKAVGAANDVLRHDAGCVLILWSHNMRERLLAEPQGGYIGQEILTGLRNGTALFCCLDMQPSADDICDTLEKQTKEFVADFRRTIQALHILPLGRPPMADGRERKQLEEDMRKLALDLYYKIDSVRRGVPRAAGDDPRVNNLLNLIDREHAVARIVPKGLVHVVSGRRAECRLNDLVQRLREIELPSISRSGDVHWRVKIVRDGLDPNTAWVQRSIEWPVMAAQASDGEKLETTVRAGLETVLDNLARRLELPRRDKSEDGFIMN